MKKELDEFELEWEEEEQLVEPDSKVSTFLVHVQNILSLEASKIQCIFLDETYNVYMKIWENIDRSYFFKILKD